MKQARKQDACVDQYCFQTGKMEDKNGHYKVMWQKVKKQINDRQYVM